jgi:hypothetical protein
MPISSLPNNFQMLTSHAAGRVVALSSMTVFTRSDVTGQVLSGLLRIAR